MMISMRVVAGVAVLIVSLATVCPTSVAQEAAGELYEKALYLEEAKGELQQALDAYEHILRAYPDDRDVRARSQLHIGLCYEKLGLAQAKRAYQKVISDYPEQAGVVNTARARLAALRAYEAEPARSAMTVRKVWEGGEVDDTGEISPDGKFISYVDWDSGNLALYEIASGKKRHLTNEGTWDSTYAYALYSRWSPDGRQLAYSWHCGDTLTLYITNLQGTSHRRLCSTGGEVTWYRVCDWSGKHILAERTLADTMAYAVLISADDGALRVVGSLGRAVGHEMAMSPDGRYIAYDAPEGKGELSYDVFVMATGSGHSLPLVQSASHDRLLGWVAGGGQILFASDRSGNPAIWSVQVVDGRASGDPTLVKETRGPHLPQSLGSARGGAFYYAEVPNTTDVYVVKVDPTTGRVVSPPREAINRFVGSNGTPDYSPDGKSLAYVSRRGPLQVTYTMRPEGNLLCIRSLDTGAEREIDPGLERFGFPRWAPDSRSIMVVNFEEGRWAHYLIDTHSEEVELAFASSKPNLVTDHEWCADGESVYLIRDIGDSTSLVVRDLESGEEKELLRRTRGELDAISRSPDGGWLSFMGRHPERELQVMPASGGVPRVVHRFEAGDYRWLWHIWTADNKYILLPKIRSPKKDLICDIWRIPVDGGEPQNTGVRTTRPWQMSAHPDGRHIAYSSSGASPEPPRIWVMENFLPKGAGRAEASTVPVDEPTGLRLRKVADVERTVYPQQLGLQGRVSPDGKYLSCVDWETGDLALFELATGKMHRVTNKGSWEDSSANAEGSTWSPDGKRIAFYWWDGRGGSSLSVIGLDGSDPQVVLRDSTISWLEPYDWSPDGRTILAAIGRTDKTGGIALVPLRGDSVRVVVRFSDVSGRGWPEHMCFSPDGRTIAYDLSSATPSPGHDIYLVGVDGGKSIPLVRHPADDYVLGWSHDGGELLFASSRTGTYGLYAVAVTGTAGEGASRLIMPNIGPIRPEGCTRDGTLYYHPPFGNRPDVYSVAYDPEHGTVTGKPEVVPVIEGSSITPDYSRCGQYLAYVSGLSHSRRTRGGNVLCVRSLESGITRELHPMLTAFGYPRWSPDSRYVYLPAFDEKGEQLGNHRIDVRDGTVTPVITDRPGELGGHALTPDGNAIVLARHGKRATSWRVTVRDLEGEDEEELYSVDKDRFYSMAISPDGRQLVIVSRPLDEQGTGSCIRVGPAAGGELRELCRLGNVARHVAWSADGSHVLFCMRMPDEDKWGLWQVAARGGEPEDLHTVMVGELRHLTVHPDGTQIAFQSSGPIKNAELWAIENLAQELSEP